MWVPDSTCPTDSQTLEDAESVSGDQVASSSSVDPSDYGIFSSMYDKLVATFPRDCVSPVNLDLVGRRVSLHSQCLMITQDRCFCESHHQRIVDLQKEVYDHYLKTGVRPKTSGYFVQVVRYPTAEADGDVTPCWSLYGN